jgi:hypothetical protein
VKTARKLVCLVRPKKISRKTSLEKSALEKLVFQGFSQLSPRPSVLICLKQCATKKDI